MPFKPRASKSNVILRVGHVFHRFGALFKVESLRKMTVADDGLFNARFWLNCFIAICSQSQWLVFKIAHPSG